MVAEGIIDGKVVCTYKRMPSRRSTKLRMYVDTEGKQLVADGSDFIVVVAEVTDDSGNVRRLAKENIVFTVEGEGRVIWGCLYQCQSAHGGVWLCSRIDPFYPQARQNKGEGPCAV